MDATSHRLVVRLGKQFECPFCKTQYILEKDDDALLVVLVSREDYCDHLDAEIFPASSSTNCSEYEVYFKEVTNHE